MTTTTHDAGPRTRGAGLIRSGAALGAGIAALAAWALLTGPLSLDLQARFGDEISDVGPVSVAVSAVMAGLGGWAVAAMVERRAARPRRRWLQIALFVAVSSLGGPFINAEGTEAIAGLVTLHVVTALVVVPAVTATVPTTGKPRS